MSGYTYNQIKFNLFNHCNFLKQLIANILKFILVSLFFHIQNKDLHNTTNFASQNIKLSLLKVILDKTDTLFLQFNQNMTSDCHLILVSILQETQKSTYFGFIE